MKELVVISGKGGTGKTSLTASFAALAHQAVLADCDVDASDLHLILSPTLRHRTEFARSTSAFAASNGGFTIFPGAATSRWPCLAFGGPPTDGNPRCCTTSGRGAMSEAISASPNSRSASCA